MAERSEAITWRRVRGGAPNATPSPLLHGPLAYMTRDTRRNCLILWAANALHRSEIPFAQACLHEYLFGSEIRGDGKEAYDELRRMIAVTMELDYAPGLRPVTKRSE